MKLLEKIGLKLMNGIITIYLFVAVYVFSEGLFSGKMNIMDYIVYMAIAYAVYKVLKSAFVQNMVCRLFKWNPVGDALNRGTAQFQRDYAGWIRRREEQQKIENENAAKRQAAEDAAAFHEYQAKRYQGTYDGYRHANLANKYRNDARG